MIVFVTGARPNFIKVQPMIDKCKEIGIEYSVYNSNQHDKNMQVFTMGVNTDTNIPNTVFHNREGRFVYMISSFSSFIDKVKPDIVVIVGDTDTSFACALVADMRSIPVAHVESGMRSYYKMPEETNRIAIDQLASYRFAPTKYNLELLLKERLDGVHVGNIMIESLLKYWKPKYTDGPDYILMEMHRPENDDKIKDIIEFASFAKFNIKWVVHPRYINKDYYKKSNNIEYLSPQKYEDMLNLVMNSVLVITDSGGLQVDTSYLGVPCITFRKATEWVITVEKGTNTLVSSVEELEGIYIRKMNRKNNIDFSEELWDNKVSERIINYLKEGIG